jgi:hypothetical protein
MDSFAILMHKKDNLSQKEIMINLKIIGKKQKKVILLFIKIFKLNLDKVDVQYNSI